MRALFENNKNIIFFSQKGWEFLGKTNKRTVIENDEIADNCLPIDPIELRSIVIKWLPVIYRWTDLSVGVEHTLCATILLISQIARQINNLRLDAVIFHTGVAHHYDSMVLSIACEICQVRQVYLYSNVFDGGLIPLIQHGGFDKRKVLSWKGGHKTYSDLIDEYITKRVQGETPATSDPQTIAANWWKCNIVIALAYATYQNSLRIFDATRFLFRNSKVARRIEVNDYSLLNHTKLLFSQFLYLREYYNRCVSLTPSNSTSSGSAPIRLMIVAHYQPEATSFPEGWNYFTHIDMAIKVRSLGYSDIIYYKEHYATKFYIERHVGLTRVGISRSREYLNALLQLRCVLVSPDKPVSLGSPILPLTITGTIAIERALLGLRTVVFGRPWYLGLPGTIHVDELESLREIPPSWTVPDKNIAIQAKEFLINQLSHNTITNIAAIGTGKRNTDREEARRFEAECKKLLSFINENNLN